MEEGGSSSNTAPLFRCPQCEQATALDLRRQGKQGAAQVRFSTMSELKRHLASEHNVGSSGGIDPAQRTLASNLPSNGESDFEENDCHTVSRNSSGMDSGRASQVPQDNVSTLEGLLERAQSLEDHLRRTHVSASLVDRRRETSESAVERLSSELLRCKQQYWTAVDSMQKAHDEARGMRHSLVRGDTGAIDKELASQCARLSDEVSSAKASERKKAAELEAVRARCQSLELECACLQQSAQELARQADSNAEAVAVLKSEVCERDRNAEQLNTFLLLQAKRQEVARKELRTYISSLEQQVERLTGLRSGQAQIAPKKTVIGDLSLSKSFEINPDLPEEIASILSKTSLSNPDNLTSDVDSDSPSEVEHHSDTDSFTPPPRPSLTITPASTGKPQKEDSPEEKALFCVFQYLTTVDLFRAGAVCKQWRAVSRRPELWHTVVLDRPRLPNKVLESMAQWCKETTSIRLDGLLPRNARPNESIKEFIKAEKGAYEAGLAHLLSACGGHLKKLRVSDCSILFTDKVLWLASLYCPLLEDFVYVSEEFPASPEAIWSLGNGCKGIKALRIPPVHLTEAAKLFSDHCLHNIAKGWPSLTVLAIGGPSLTLDGLGAIALGCPRLEVLELDRVAAFNEYVARTLCKVGLRGLQQFDLFLTRITADAVVTFVGACPRLESISIHLGISDYYSNPADPTSIAGFKAAMKELQDLTVKPPYTQILNVNCTYG